MTVTSPRETPTPSPPRPTPRLPWAWGLCWLTLTAATAALARLDRPPIPDPDTQASVLYFQRITAGVPLEEPLFNTPKPLLTAAWGLAWELAHDWRALTLLTTAAFALGLTALARAVARAGGWMAAGFVTLALLGFGDLTLQVARANSVVWALAGWGVAAWALTGPRRRWALGAAALLLAGLARSEAWLLLPPAALWGLRAARAGGERRALWLLAPLPAPLGWLLHDWLLIRDPLFWARVADRYTAAWGREGNMSPAAWISEHPGRFAGGSVLVALALVGVAWLVSRRAWVWLCGLGALFAGLLAVLAVYDWRGTYVSFRYYDPAAASLRLAAAFGAAAVASGLLARVPRPPALARVRLPAPVRVALGAAAGMALAAGLCSPLATADSGTQDALDEGARASGNTTRAVAALRPLVAPEPGRPAPVILASSAYRLRVAIELGLPLGQVRDLTLAGRTASGTAELLTGADFVVHDTNLHDLDRALYGPLEVTGPAMIEKIRLTPVLVDASRGLYVLRVDRAGR